MKQKTLKGKAAFSLVEVMVATVILGSVFTALFGAIGQGINMVETARDYTRVSQILLSEMEDLRTLKWTELQAEKGWSGYKRPDTAFDTEYNQKYWIATSIWDHWSNSGMLYAYVVCGFFDHTGAWRWRYLYTEFTEDGLNDYYYRNV